MPQQLPQLGVLFLRSQCHCFSLSALALPVAIDYEQDDGERKGESPVPYVAMDYSSQWYGTYSLFWYLLNLVSQVFLSTQLSAVSYVQEFICRKLGYFIMDSFVITLYIPLSYSVSLLKYVYLNRFLYSPRGKMIHLCIFCQLSMKKISI